ncbi:hypothetical protein JOQ06_016135, partial [Pogonophryne albipinna]
EEGRCEELGGQLLAPSRAVPASCIEQQQGRTITFGAQHGGGCSTWPTERGRSGEPESSQLRPHGLAWLEPSVESWHRSILIPALLFLTPVQNDPLSVDLSGLQAMHYG